MNRSLADKHRIASEIQRSISDSLAKHMQDGVSYGELLFALSMVMRRWTAYLIEDEFAESSAKAKKNAIKRKRECDE